MKRQVLTNFARLTDAALANLGGTTLQAMTGNANFPTPQPTLEDYGTAVDDFKDKLETASRKGSPMDFSIKNESREALLAQMRLLAQYVNNTANGVVSALLSSGFPLKAQPGTMPVPAVPERVRLSDGRQRGQLRLDFDAVKYAWEYEYAVAHENDGQGQPQWGELLATTISRGNIIAPVVAGLTYFVRVRARNGRGIGDWCEPVSLIAR